MSKTKLGFRKPYEYPVEKARKILEEDNTFLNDSELNQLIKVLTLLAEQEAELLTKSPHNQHE